MKIVRKLTDQEKIDIIEKYATGKYTCRQLSKEYGMCDSAVSAFLKRRKIPVGHSRANRRYTINEHFFDSIDNEHKAYFLGLLYADGYNYNSNYAEITLTLQENDRDILDKMNISIESNKPLMFTNRIDKNPNWKNTYRLSIRSKHMSQQLAKLGCFQKKSLTLKFPTEEQVPSHLIRHFIRGYFDGDGCVTYNGKKQLYCSIVSTLMFCERLKEIFKLQIDINCSIYRCNQSIIRDTTTRTISFGGNLQCIRFKDWLYQDATVYLERKFDKFNN